MRTNERLRTARLSTNRRSTSANAGGMNAVVQQPTDTGVIAVTPTSSVPGYVLPLVILGAVAALASSSGT